VAFVLDERRRVNINSLPAGPRTPVPDCCVSRWRLVRETRTGFLSRGFCKKNYFKKPNNKREKH